MSLIISRIMKHLKESSDLMTAEELIYHEFLGLHPYQKYELAIELKVAELATTQPYRAVA